MTLQRLTSLKAITVHQPYAWAIAHAGKTPENRSQNYHHRGPLAIHASKTWHEDGSTDPRVVDAAARAGIAVSLWADGGRRVNDMHRAFAQGVIVAVTTLVDVHPARPGCCPEWGSQGDGIWHLDLEDTIALPKPIPARGYQGMWELSPYTLDLVNEQICHVA